MRYANAFAGVVQSTLADQLSSSLTVQAGWLHGNLLFLPFAATAPVLDHSPACTVAVLNALQLSSIGP